MDITEIEKRVRGDWSLLTNQAADLYSMQDFFAFPAKLLKEQLGELESDVELGVVEYKQVVLGNAFSFIESLKFDARGFDKIGREADRLRYALYLVMIQSFLCRGIIRIRRPKTDRVSVDNNDIMENTEKKHDNVDLKTVIAELSARLKAKPALQQHPLVKNILMQVNIYKKELAETQRLAASMPKDKSAGLVSNFSKRVAEITERARDNYFKLIAELEPAPEKPVDGLPSYNLKPLVPVYEAQAKAFASLVSRFSLVKEQHSGTREALLPLLPKRDSYLKLTERELEAFTQLEPFEGGRRKAAKEFTKEIVRNLKREADEAFR